MKPRLLAVVAALVALGGCQARAIEPLPPAPKVPAPTTTTVIDYSGVGLAAVAGRTTTTVGIGPGKATMGGVVNGPQGPVPGAVVRAERLVGEASATVDIVTGPDGRFELPAILGGRYRVRAWKPAPDNLALVEPQVFFLEGSEKKQLTLTVTLYQGVSATAAIAPDPPLINSPSNLVVLVVNRSVDPAGIVRSAPVPSVRAELFGAGDWRVLTPVVTTADEAGRVRWTLECRRAGQQPLSVVIGETDAFNLNLPGCAVPPPSPEDQPTDAEATTTTVAATPASTTSTTARATTTTPAPASSTTTTTTRGGGGGGGAGGTTSTTR